MIARSSYSTGLLGLLLVCACNKSGETAVPDPVPEEGATEPDDDPTAADPAPSLGPNYRAYEPSEAAETIVGAEDRTADDVEDDARLRPAELLTFTEVAPGMKVADLGAGTGYTTELLVRAVGSGGMVYAQNDAFALEHYAKDSWPKRLARPINEQVIRVDREFSDPLPAEATGLDLVTSIFAYHEAVVRDQDTAAMNAAVFEHLAPGGLYVVVDHSARSGTGVADTDTLYRIDEQLVVEEVERAGFELVETADFLRAPQDTRDWEVWKRGYATDRFALKFQKPQ